MGCQFLEPAGATLKASEPLVKLQGYIIFGSKAVIR